MFIGIDLGTTNSSLAFIRDSKGDAQNISVTPQDTPYDTLLRSMVFFEENGDLSAVGEKATRQKYQGKAGRAVESFKPYNNRRALMTEVDVKEEIQLPDNPINGQSRFRTTFYKKKINGPYSRDEIVKASTAILKYLFNAYKAQNKSHLTPEKILIGMPFCHWDFAKRRILHAAVLAGLVSSFKEALRKIYFVFEPVAIGFTLPLMGKTDRNVLVFDFGGGTLDVAIMKFGPSSGARLEPVELLALGGLRMGGRDFDELLQNSISKKNPFFEKDWEKMTEGERYIFREHIEGLKIDLSQKESVSIKTGTKFGDISLDRKGLEETLNPKLEEVKVCLQKIMKSAQLEPEDVDCVLMSGGSSLMPCVQNLVESVFDSKKTEIIKPDPLDTKNGGSSENAMTAVSKGLAIYGARSKLRLTCPFEYKLFDPETEKEYLLLDRDTPYDEQGKACGNNIKVDLSSESTSKTLWLFQKYLDLGDPELVMQIRKVPYSAEMGSIEFSCAAFKDRPMPLIELRDSSGSTIALPNPYDFNEMTAKKFIKNDDEPVFGQAPNDSPIIPSQILKVGDFITFENNKLSGCRKSGEGKIEKIKGTTIDRSFYQPEASWDLSHYILKMQKEGATFDIQIKPMDVKEHKPSEGKGDIYRESLS